MLTATRAAERDLFGMLDADARTAPASIGEWSAKDVQGHLAAWRAIEARRLQAAAADDASLTAGDPAPTDPDDPANARLHAERVDWTWDEVAAEADASVAALVAAIGESTSDALCDCSNEIAGTGASGVNHAMAHLSDIARLGGGEARYDAYAREIAAVLLRNHLPPRDSGVILYNVACHHALTGELDDARSALRIAFARRPDLLEHAGTDPDLVSLREELTVLAGPA